MANPRRGLSYDKNGDMHYDIISAFIKSMRGSDPDATVYWLARMIDSGEDPKFIARRIMIQASEDIGNATLRHSSSPRPHSRLPRSSGIPSAASTWRKRLCTTLWPLRATPARLRSMLRLPTSARAASARCLRIFATDTVRVPIPTDLTCIHMIIQAAGWSNSIFPTVFRAGRFGSPRGADGRNGATSNPNAIARENRPRHMIPRMFSSARGNRGVCIGTVAGEPFLA